MFLVQAGTFLCFQAGRSSATRSSASDLTVVSRSINMLSVTDFVRKGIISGVRVQAGLHLDMLDADRSPNMQSAFLPELHRWISKLTARHLHACPPGDLLITMVKETVIFFIKKSFEKIMKKVVSLLDVKEMKTRNDCEIACDSIKRANVVLHVGLCEEIFARKHTATHKPTSAQPLSAAHSDQRDTHNRLWSPLAYGLGGNKIANRYGAPRPPMTDVGTETAFFQLTTPVAME